MLGATIGAWALASMEVELSWTVPEGCPDESVLRADVERFLGRSMEDVGPTRARFMVRVEGGTPFTATIETVLDRVTTERTLEDEDCRILERGVAFVIATTLDPDLDLELLDALEGPPVQDVSATAPGLRAPVVSESVPADESRGGLTVRRGAGPRTSIRYGLGVEFVGNFGALPGYAPGVGISGALILGRHARFELGGAWLFARPLRLEDSIGANIRLVSGVVRGCGVPRAGPVVGSPGTELEFAL